MILDSSDLSPSDNLIFGPSDLSPSAGIEEIGVAMEEPFSILPLPQLCDTIEANIRELQKVHGGSAAASGGSASDNGSSAEGQPLPAPSARGLLKRGLHEAASAGAAA
ncbi:hypothetical protein ABPG75_006603 [Micractinium tetrahymenae]